MSNSSLISYTRLSPNHSGRRTHAIDRITPHCVVGQCSVETLGGIFASKARKASCQYGIGSDGRIALICDESNRSWCSSSAANDQRAVTIECASDTTPPYAFKPEVYQALVTLCADICRRNGKTRLIWLGDKAKTLSYSPKSNEMILTVHRWFANKSCPGDWMMARMGQLAADVNALLTPAGKEGTDMTAKETQTLIDKAIKAADAKRRYERVGDLPEWALDTINKLLTLGVIKGTGSGLHLDETLVRVLVILDRCGVFDK